MSYSSYGIEKGQLIRVPATANLMIDSADRPNPTTTTPFRFQILKNQSILNGYFTRIGTTEVVVEWCQNNINAPQNQLLLDVSGFSFTIDVAPGIYNVAQCLDAIITEANPALIAHFGMSAPVLSINDASGNIMIKTSNQTDISVLDSGVNTLPGSLALRLDLSLGEQDPFVIVNCPDLRPYRYMDIVCEDLTAVQDVKDSTTQSFNRDVLTRWYFSEDVPGDLDAYGFPILMGYTRYCRRRTFNPPKQIKWEQNLPLGNLTFSCYDENGELLVDQGTAEPKTNFLITLQLTEG